MTTPQQDEAYARGQLDGKVAAALARHDDHFKRINGSLEDMAATVKEQQQRFHSDLHTLTLQVQRLADLGDSREKTVEKTAAALKVADDQRRDAGDQRSRPINTAVAIIAAIVAALGLLIAAYIATKA